MDYPGLLPDPGHCAYRPSTRPLAYRWPGGAGLAVYLGFNLEHFAFGAGLGAGLAPASPQPDVLNHAWREYGNRVGAWRWPAGCHPGSPKAGPRPTCWPKPATATR